MENKMVLWLIAITTRMADRRFVVLPLPALGVKGVSCVLCMNAKLLNIFLKRTYFIQLFLAIFANRRIMPTYRTGPRGRGYNIYITLFRCFVMSLLRYLVIALSRGFVITIPRHHVIMISRNPEKAGMKIEKYHILN